MDWPQYPSASIAAEHDPDQSIFDDIDFPFDPSLLVQPHPQLPHDFVYEPLPPLSVSAAGHSLPSPSLPTGDQPSWPTMIGPPSPTASTASLSSASTSSPSTISSSSNHSSRSTTPNPLTAPATTTTTATPAITLPSKLAASPDLSHKRPRPPPSSAVTTPSSDDSDALARRKRAPSTVQTAQQRAELKRQKHREIDANRIQREKAAVKRLTLLTTNSNNTGADDCIKDEEEEVDEPEGKRDKVTVLEDSARKIDDLQRLVSQLTDACSSQQANNRTLLMQLQMAARQLAPQLEPPDSSSAHSSFSSASSTHALSLLPPAVSQRLDAQIGSASLRSSWFAASSVSMCVVRCATGCVLDVNDRMLQESGWRREHIVGRLLCPPYDYIIQQASYTTQKWNGSELAMQRILVDGPDGRMVPARTQRQYERSKQMIHDLYKGEKEHIFCVFRYQMRDGRVYEVKTALWTTSWMEVKGRDGVVSRRPESCFLVCSYADSVCVEEGTPPWGET